MGTGETRRRPSGETPGEPTRGWTGSGEPEKREERERGESGAGVGGGQRSDDGLDNRTDPSEGPPAESDAQRRGSGIAARLLTRANKVSEGRRLGQRATTGGGVECAVRTARGRAVRGKTACTVLRGEAGNGVMVLGTAEPAKYCKGL